MSLPSILCVDDEKHILNGLALVLRREFDVVTATSGEDGLELLRERDPFAVVISDMRMPKMDGATFLARAREVAPDSVRVLLTGAADLESAIKAINEGEVFRFLTKPCAQPDLIAATRTALRQHELVTAERVLQEETLRGSIQTMTDILALTNPSAFGRAARIQQYVVKLCGALSFPEAWRVEVAAMLSQIGCVTLPAATLSKLEYGSELDSAEAAMVARIPVITERLLSHIPRLEIVRAIIARQGERFTDATLDDPIAAGAAILGIAVRFDELESAGRDPVTAVQTLRRDGRFPEPYLGLLSSAFALDRSGNAIEIAVSELTSGMVVMDDVRSREGHLLLPRGYEVGPGFLEILKNLGDEVAEAKVAVSLPESAELVVGAP